MVCLYCRNVCTMLYLSHHIRRNLYLSVLISQLCTAGKSASTTSSNLTTSVDVAHAEIVAPAHSIQTSNGPLPVAQDASEAPSKESLLSRVTTWLNKPSRHKTINDMSFDE